MKFRTATFPLPVPVIAMPVLLVGEEQQILGVDGLMTDRPAALKDVLRRRRQWAGEVSDKA